jgi:hypothetical protein
MGTLFPPFPVPEAINKYNAKTLLRIVNDPDTFDKDLKPAKKDRLHLHFVMGPFQNMDYGFEYDGTKWKTCKYDVFGWSSHHDKKGGGLIESALSQKGGVKAISKKTGGKSGDLER